MADKPKPKKAAPGKAKPAKANGGKTAKAAETVPAATKVTAKAATAKTTGKAVKKAKKTVKASGDSHTAKPTKHVAPAAEATAEKFYVCSGVGAITIRDAAPGSGIRSVEFSSFADAHHHLLEELIATIEKYESALHAVRRAKSFADYLERQG